MENFADQNLRGRSFKGQNLTGADFSHSDIRGADFTNTTLVKANFTSVKAGQPPLWRFISMLISASISIVAGLIVGWGGGVVGTLSVETNPSSPGSSIFPLVAALVIPFLVAIYIYIVVQKGLGASLGAYALVVSGTLTFAVIAIPNEVVDSAIIAFILLLFIISFIVSTTFLSLSVCLSYLLGHKYSAVACIFFASMGIAIGSYEGAEVNVLVSSQEKLITFALSIILSGIAILLSLYVGKKATAEDVRYSLLNQLAVQLSSLRGTKFCSANCDDVDFAKASLNGTDMRKATLRRTNLFKAFGTDQLIIRDGYLKNTKVRKLLVSKDGQGQKFENLDLRDVNLEGADLSNSSFQSTNLSEANLSNADFSKADLTQVQLYKANLTGACFTGAYIQDWGISIHTNLQDVTCDYVYMRAPTHDDPDPCRKPDRNDQFFEQGDFADFIAPIIKTLDLYQQQNVDPRRIAETYKTIDLFHHKGLDPSAAAVAFKRLAEQHPESGLEVVALEGRGEHKVRLQARVSEKTDRSELSADYYKKYNEATALPYGDLQSLLTAISEKDERIQSLENMVSTAMKSEKFYVEAHYDLGKSAEDIPPTKKILILSANPQSVDRNRLDAEVRAIQMGLERAKQRDQFEIISRWAVRTEDLRRALLDYEPHVVQFSGVGIENKGLALENENGEVKIVTTSALTSLFELFKDRVECVFFNACYSAKQTDAISLHIPYVIGMKHAIGERAALEFAVGFYDALGAGRSIEDAYKLGCISIDLEGLPESLVPVFKKKGE